MGSYRYSYRGLIEGSLLEALSILNSPPVVSFNKARGGSDPGTSTSLRDWVHPTPYVGFRV